MTDLRIILSTVGLIVAVWVIAVAIDPPCPICTHYAPGGFMGPTK